MRYCKARLPLQIKWFETVHLVEVNAQQIFKFNKFVVKKLLKNGIKNREIYVNVYGDWTGAGGDVEEKIQYFCN